MSPHAHTFEERFRHFLERHSLAAKGGSVACAISGGPDSMVMLHLFLGLRSEWDLSLAVVHVNHQLRSEESDQDESFVRAFAHEHGLPVYSERVDTLAYQHAHKLSKQEAARILRYEVFERAQKSLGMPLVATAHTATDNAETVLLNVLRGTGIRGLAGIPIRRDPAGIIRPILFALREEVEQYAAEHAIRSRTDSSNLLVSSTRNFLRHEILPKLRDQVNADVTGALNRVSATMRDLVSRIDRELELGSADVLATDERGRVTVDLKNLRLAPAFLQDEYLLLALRQAGAPISTEKVLQLRDLCEHQSGRRHDLTRSVVAVRDHDRLILGPQTAPDDFSYDVALGQEYTFSGFSFSAKPLAVKPQGALLTEDRAIVDGASLGAALTVRSWRPGDWFMPLGMHGRKKLSDFFTDEKIPHEHRRRIPIVESGGAIVWVCGLRIDERAKVTPETKRWVELAFHHHG